jgi:hypothetical protein
MGDIGPSQGHYEVLPGARFGIEEADRWTVPPTPNPEPIPKPEPGGPEPGPDPAPLPSL